MDIVAGIDIGGTNSVIGLVNQHGECLVESTISTRSQTSFNGFIGSISDEIKKQLSSLGNNYTIKGVGIGAPNGSYKIGAIVDAPNLTWKGTLPLCEEISKYTGVPSVVTNDANAAAMGEKLFGSAKDMNDFIVITLGTGLGSGIVTNGSLVVGHDGFAGELGHTVAVSNGRQCGCGKKGCLETYASATGIRRTIFMLLSESNQPRELRSISFDKLSAKIVTEAALKGDPIAKEAFEYTGKILGIRLADAVATLSPEAIFLFGGLAKSGALIIEPTQRYMEENLFPIFRNKIKIMPSGLEGKNAAVLGAAALIWKEIDN